MQFDLRLLQSPYFTSWHLKGGNWKSLSSRGCGQTSATVCLPYHSSMSDFLTFFYLIITALKPTSCCRWRRCVWGLLPGYRFTLSPGVQKSQACAFEESGSAEINLCDLPALGEMWLSVEQRCCRGQCRPEQVQPPPSYLWTPLPTKLPRSECWERCKKVFTARGGQGLEDR